MRALAILLVCVPLAALAQPATTPSAVPTPAPPAPPAASARWFTGGALYDKTNEGYGLRVELDLFAHGPWRAGVAASMANTGTDLAYNGTLTGYLELRDLKAMLVVAHHADIGNWQLRGSFGAGAVRTDAEGWGQPYANGNPHASRYLVTDGMFPVVEASASVGRMLGAEWSIVAGAVVTRYQETLEIEAATIARYNVEVMWFGGVRHRL